jgi:hypothetical protein
VIGRKGYLRELKYCGKGAMCQREAGSVNGEDGYHFMVWARNGNSDTFRIKIWEEDEFGEETVVYDNGFNQEISGGSIVIHAK